MQVAQRAFPQHGEGFMRGVAEGKRKTGQEAEGGVGLAEEERTGEAALPSVRILPEVSALGNDA